MKPLVLVTQFSNYWKALLHQYLRSFSGHRQRCNATVKRPDPTHFACFRFITSTNEKLISTSDLTNPPHPRTPSAKTRFKQFSRSVKNMIKLWNIFWKISRCSGRKRNTVDLIERVSHSFAVYAHVKHLISTNTILDSASIITRNRWLGLRSRRSITRHDTRNYRSVLYTFRSTTATMVLKRPEIWSFSNLCSFLPKLLQKF